MGEQAGQGWRFAASSSNRGRYKPVGSPVSPQRVAATSPVTMLTLRHRPHVRNFIAEFIGTFVLVAYGTGSGAQYILSNGTSATALSSVCTWGIGVAMGIYVSGGVSGGQLNPAVSVAYGVVGRLPWRKVPVYVAGQYLGSFCACCLVYLVYFEAMENFDGGSRQVLGPNGTAAIWATYPQPFASVWTGLGDQVFSTGLLLLCMMAMSDPRNMMPSKGLYPIANGLLVIGLGLSFRLNCGNAMNPARDLAPRLFSVVAGWGLGPLSLRNYNWFWVNVLGPHIGAVVGALAYQGCVGLHWPQGSDNDEKLMAGSSEPQPLSDFVKDDEAPVITDDGQWQHGSQPRI